MKLNFSLTRLLAIAALFIATTLQVSADVAVYNPTATASASIFQRGARINQIVFSNAATNAVTLTFVDSPTNTTTYVVGAYTNNVLTLGNVITTFTNILGVVQSSTNNTLTSTLTVQAATTNSYRTVLVQLVPASATVTYTPPSGLQTGFGLSASTTATNVTATINYLPSR